MPTRLVFMGTPAFAVPSLDALAGLPDIEIVTVITQPDRPAGRGQTLRPSPVKARALALGLPVWSPENLKGADDQQRLRDLVPDVQVVVAYGEILRRAVLDIPPRGTLNVHASLLPRHRGAAPVVGALLAGDAETGVTIMLLDEGMDTGPMLAQRAIPIEPHHTGGTLTNELAQLGAELLAETLPRWLARAIEPEPQDASLATKTRLIRKEDGRLDWHHPARDLANQVRAFDPWPGTFTHWRGEPLKVLKANALPLSAAPPPAPPGTVAQTNGMITVATGEGWLRLDEVQLAGKKPTPATLFLHGHRDFVGSVLGGLTSAE